MTPLKLVMSIFMFWLVLGGLFQLFDIEDTNNHISGADDVNIITKIYNMFTFNVEGIPIGLKYSLTSFMSFALALSIYVLVRGQ